MESCVLSGESFSEFSGFAGKCPVVTCRLDTLAWLLANQSTLRDINHETHNSLSLNCWARTQLFKTSGAFMIDVSSSGVPQVKPLRFDCASEPWFSASGLI